MRYTLLTSSMLALALAGCATTKSPISPVPKEVPHDVVVTVATGCIAVKGRPGIVTPLDQTIAPADWKTRTASARAAAIQAQAGRRLNYEDVDRAATSSCK